MTKNIISKRKYLIKSNDWLFQFLQPWYKQLYYLLVESIKRATMNFLTNDTLLKRNTVNIGHCYKVIPKYTSNISVTQRYTVLYYNIPSRSVLT